MKVAETLALDKKKQKSVVKDTKRLSKEIKAGKIEIRENRRQRRWKTEQTRGLIYVGHLPHGFYEEEMKNYFAQFGRITNVKVCRSNKTGNSKGYGFVEFAHPEVAKIAAETMNNYVMFKKRLVAYLVPVEKRPPHIFHGKASTPQNYSRKRRRDRINACRNKDIDDDAHLKEGKVRLTRLQRQLKTLKKLGIDYDLKPVDVPKELESMILS